MPPNKVLDLSINRWAYMSAKSSLSQCGSEIERISIEGINLMGAKESNCPQRAFLQSFLETANQGHSAEHWAPLEVSKADFNGLISMFPVPTPKTDQKTKHWK